MNVRGRMDGRVKTLIMRFSTLPWGRIIDARVGSDVITLLIKIMVSGCNFFNYFQALYLLVMSNDSEQREL